ncbi:MAG: hypothetical protein FWD71_00395 [Oscillospiraceae bacterium]|nr:hypothetical protein [Oscillospiraceae bacterium]
MKNYDLQTPAKSTAGKKQDKILDAAIYLIVIITMVMFCPLIYMFASNYSSSNISAQNSNDNSNGGISKTRKYTVTENELDISGLKNTVYGDLNLIAAKVTDDGRDILFCGAANSVFKIAVINPAETGGDAHSIAIYQSALKYNLYQSVSAKDYTYKDYSDGTFFFSNDKTAFLFDMNQMRITSSYNLPSNYHIYQTALSNAKDRIAIAAEEGFFVCASNALITSSPNPADIKELISTYVNAGGVKNSARYPFWSNGDQYIYYKMCADNYVKNAGMTTGVLGGNEQLTSLECTDFLFLNNDFIFYYFSTNSETSPENLFRCGYFTVSDKKMTDIMKSQVYYFDINVSSNGTHLAALSHNGNMVKISIIDIHTKKLIYSSLYDDIYDYSFSPNEKNLIIYGKKDGKDILSVIQIDWTEE